MKRTIAVLLALGLLGGVLAAGPAEAKKKKKRKPKPVETVLYFHGGQQLGEAEIPDAWQNNLWHTMDVNEPDGSQAKSQFVTNYVRGPNSNCSGNGLLPVWKGEMAGRVVGDVELSVHTAATPGTPLEARLYPDAVGGCNEAAQEPAAAIVTQATAGQGVTEIVFEDVDFNVVASLVVQFNIERIAEIPAPSPAGGSLAHPGQVRIFYDSTSNPTSITFSCIPAGSSKTCAG